MQKTVVEVIRRKLCTGCSACMNVCPNNAINMILNVCGFLVPNINTSICSNCGICFAQCPALKEFPLIEHGENDIYPKFYGGWSLDANVVNNSSSGGIFTELTKHVLEQKGIVFGARWANGSVEHIGIDSFADIPMLTGSKYLQSKIDFTYRVIKNIINDNKKVLFVGTPCQVAGLNSYIRHDNLYTADLVCHGVPSYLIYKKYLESVSNNKKIDSINFRDKENGWNKYHVTLMSNNTKVSSECHLFNPFYIGYLDNLYLNTPCYQCQFSQIPRTGDITLGDFWGVPTRLYNRNKGVSVILGNTKKGEEVLKVLINHKRIYLMDVTKYEAVNCNKRLISGYLVVPKVREKILLNVEKYDFESILFYIRIPDFWDKVKFKLKMKLNKYLRLNL